MLLLQTLLTFGLARDVIFAPVFQTDLGSFPDFAKIPVGSLLRIGYAGIECSTGKVEFTGKLAPNSLGYLFTSAKKDYDVSIIFTDLLTIDNKHEISACYNDIPKTVDIYKKVIAATGVNFIEFAYVPYSEENISAIKRQIVSAKLLKKQLPDLRIGLSLPLQNKSSLGFAESSLRFLNLSRQANLDYDTIFFNVYHQNPGTMYDSILVAITQLAIFNIFNAKIGVTGDLQNVFSPNNAKILYDISQKVERISYLGMNSLFEDKENGYKVTEALTNGFTGRQ